MAAKAATKTSAKARATVAKAPAETVTAPAKKATSKPAAQGAAATKAASAGERAPAARTATKSAPAKRASKAAAAATGRQPDVPAGTEWTAAELTTIRAELAADIIAMQAEYDQSLAELDELQQAGTDGAGDDQADAGSKTFDREQELSIAANRFDLLSQMMHAVERIDHGTYGFCEVCGRPIPRVRLQAFPMATLDVACKQREERR